MSAPDTREDTELVKLVLAGDTELYAVLVNRYRTRVSRYVERFTHDIEDARDVTHDVFIKVYGALDSFDPRFKFSTWLFRIAGNAAIDHLRRRRVRLLPLERPAWENGEARAPDPPPRPCGGGGPPPCRSSAQPGRMARRAPWIRPRRARIPTRSSPAGGFARPSRWPSTVCPTTTASSSAFVTTARCLTRRSPSSRACPSARSRPDRK